MSDSGSRSRGRPSQSVPSGEDFSQGSRSGARYEEVCAEYLRKQGYSILERNFSTRLGEIGIIAIYGEDIVFSEVKGGKEDPPPFTRVTPAKLRRILLTVQHYLHHHPEQRYCHVRVDVLSITLPDLKIRHFKDVTAH